MTRISNERGFSLIQALIAAGILAIFVSVFGDLVLNMQREVKRSKNKQDRILNNYQIDQVVTSSFGIKTSAAFIPNNNLLKACVLGGAAGTCASNCCTNGSSTPFTLLDPRDTNPNLAERAKLSGPPNGPVFYDDNSGSGCTKNCAYSVTSRFIPHCPGGVSSCDHAEHLTVEMEYTPVTGKEHLMKPVKKTLIYFVNLNYQPFLSPVTDQSLVIGGSASLSVFGNSGHPSELQNFIFDKCEALDPAIVKVTCYGFLNGTGTLKIEGISIGTTSVALKVNDAGAENNISPELIFNVTVTP